MMQAGADALIVGGGLAGSLAALKLAQAGRHTVLLERSKGAHHKVCGEFISCEAVHYLLGHGIHLDDLGAVRLDTVRLVMPTSMVEQALPFVAYSVTRRVLDEQMLLHATYAGVDVQRNAFVESLEFSQSKWCAMLRDGRTLRAPQAFLATGKHDLRGWPRLQGAHAELIAFKMYYRLTQQQLAAIGHAIELILFPGGYAGLQPVENGTVNLCLVVSAKQFRTRTSRWDVLMQFLTQCVPHLAQRLEGATPLLDAPLAASHIPYGHMQRLTQEGLWRIGDQATVIPSFCGDGMAIALHTGAMAAQYYLRGESTASYQEQLQIQLKRRVQFATVLSRFIVSFPQAAQIVRIFPGLLKQIALSTRLPQQELLTIRNEAQESAVTA